MTHSVNSFVAAAIYLSTGAALASGAPPASDHADKSAGKEPAADPHEDPGEHHGTQEAKKR